MADSSKKLSAKQAAAKLSAPLNEYLKKKELVKSESELPISRKAAKALVKKIEEYKDTLVKMRQVEEGILSKSFSEYLPEGHPELERAKGHLASSMGLKDLSSHKYVGTYNQNGGNVHKFVDTAGKVADIPAQQVHSSPERPAGVLNFGLDKENPVFLSKLAQGHKGTYHIQRNQNGQQDLFFKPHASRQGTGSMAEVPDMHHMGSFNSVPEAVQMANEHHSGGKLGTINRVSDARHPVNLKAEPSMGKSIDGLPSKTHSESELEHMSGVKPKQSIFSLMRKTQGFQGSLTDIRAPPEGTQAGVQHKEIPKITPAPIKAIPTKPQKDVVFSRGQIQMTPHAKIKEALMGKSEDKAPGAVLPSDKMPEDVSRKDAHKVKRGMKIPKKGKKDSKDPLKKSDEPASKDVGCYGCGSKFYTDSALNPDTGLCGKCEKAGKEKPKQLDKSLSIPAKPLAKKIPTLGGKSPESKMMTQHAISDAAKKAKNVQMPTIQQQVSAKMPSMKDQMARQATFGDFTPRGKWSQTQKTELTKSLEEMTKAVENTFCKDCRGKKGKCSC